MRRSTKRIASALAGATAAGSGILVPATPAWADCGGQNYWLYMFEDADYEGTQFFSNETGQWKNLSNWQNAYCPQSGTWNDCVSGFLNYCAADANGAWDANGGGSKILMRGCENPGYDTPWIGSTWNDQMSSFIIGYSCK